MCWDGQAKACLSCHSTCPHACCACWGHAGDTYMGISAWGLTFHVVVQALAEFGMTPNPHWHDAKTPFA